MSKPIVRHITHTGRYAGSTYCGEARKLNQHTRYHHSYGGWLENPDMMAEVCPACLEVFNETKPAVQPED